MSLVSSLTRYVRRTWRFGATVLFGVFVRAYSVPGRAYLTRGPAAPRGGGRRRVAFFLLAFQMECEPGRYEPSR